MAWRDSKDIPTHEQCVMGHLHRKRTVQGYLVAHLASGVLGPSRLGMGGIVYGWKAK
jgi:hypothetical protein